MNGSVRSVQSEQINTEPFREEEDKPMIPSTHSLQFPGLCIASRLLPLEDEKFSVDHFESPCGSCAFSLTSFTVIEGSKSRLNLKVQT